jgi:hypothetical protein
MHLKCALAIVVTTLTIGGGGVRAEQPAAAPPLVAQPPLTTTLPGTDAPVTATTLPPAIVGSRKLTPLVFVAIGMEPKASRADRPAREDWNCGMPVIQPPTDVDPAFEKKPDDTLTIPIRRATLRACGR